MLKLGLLLCTVLLATFKARAQSVAKNKLDAAIVRVAKKHNVPVRILRAIATVESSYGANSKLRKNTNGTYDAGPLQINSIHWSKSCRHLNIATTEGNAECAAVLLSEHQKYAGTDAAWFARYHSKTPSLKSQYETKVRKILQLQATEYKLFYSKTK